MSEVKVNKITPTADCGTVTLGDSGDTVAIASGVTLTSAGSITNSGTITNTGTISGGTITGTIDNQVNWQTGSIKTTGFTATAGEGYFCNTTSAAFTVTLPASPTAGDLVAIKDYANTFDTNNLTIARNGSNIQGTANNFVVSVEGTSITLIYVDGTQGWVSTGVSKASDIAEQPLFVAATGGCVFTCGDYKVHKFTGPGTFCVSCAGNALGSNKVDYLVVAGGGSGGGQYSGGGAGGHRFAFHLGAPSPSPFNAPACEPARSITATGYPITIGAGGPQPAPAASSDGSPSVFSTITSTGGGGASARPGGSGSGASGEPPNPGSNPKGTGNTPPVSPSQGHPGGPNSAPRRGGGGGGAGAAGASAAGGNGIALPVPWFATATGGDNFPEGRYFSGGGGGGTESTPGSPYAGGKGGGGDGGNQSNGIAGGANTGGGGGSGSRGTGSSGTYTAASGGSGIIYIKYKFQ